LTLILDAFFVHAYANAQHQFVFAPLEMPYTLVLGLILAHSRCGEEIIKG
jgi:hypothetical protein